MDMALRKELQVQNDHFLQTAYLFEIEIEVL